MNIYIAGPFFNSESKLVLTSILTTLESLGYKCWIPMRDGITCPKNTDRAQRLKVFRLDCEQLHWAECVVALLDYPLPIHQQLLLREKTPEGVSKDTPTSLPDPGTVFEIGYVNGLNNTEEKYRYVIGYANNPGFNLMVAEACDCIVSNSAELVRTMEVVSMGDDEGLKLLKIQYQKQTELKEL